MTGRTLGKQAQERWGRGQATDGPTRFYRVARASLGCQGGRVPLALHFVLPDEDTVGVLALLWQRGQAQGRQVSCLLLDKGFERVAVMDS